MNTNNIIHAYTRANALEDGVLRDVTEMGMEAGLNYPAACTAGLWADLVEPSVFAKEMGNSVEGRLWDVLYMFTMAVKGIIPNKSYKAGISQVIEYDALFVMGDEDPEPVLRKIKAICGPGDDMAPVITFMLPHED